MRTWSEAHLETLSCSLCKQPEGVSLSILQRYELKDSLALATGHDYGSRSDHFNKGSNTGPHSDRIYRNGLPVPVCLCASTFFSLFSLTSNSEGSLKLKGIHFPFLERLEFSCSTSSSSSHFSTHPRHGQVGIADLSFFPGSPWSSIPTDGS